MFPELPGINSEEIEHALANSKNSFTTSEKSCLDVRVNWQSHIFFFISLFIQFLMETRAGNFMKQC